MIMIEAMIHVTLVIAKKNQTAIDIKAGFCTVA